MRGAPETGGALVAVPSQTVGPFFHFGLTPEGTVTAVPLAAGAPRLELVVRVTDGDRQPVGDAMIEIWYAPEAVAATPRTAPVCIFARLPTAEDGSCTFALTPPAGLASNTTPGGSRVQADDPAGLRLQTEDPARGFRLQAEVPDRGFRLQAEDPARASAAHVNVCVFARGLLRHLQTRIYFAGDPAIASDAVVALVPEDRRQTLVAAPDGARADRWIFDLRLQGADETVFFDV